MIVVLALSLPVIAVITLVLRVYAAMLDIAVGVDRMIYPVADGAEYPLPGPFDPPGAKSS